MNSKFISIIITLVKEYIPLNVSCRSILKKFSRNISHVTASIYPDVILGTKMWIIFFVALWEDDVSLE